MTRDNGAHLRRLACLVLLGVSLPGCQTHAATPATPLQRDAATCDLAPVRAALALGSGMAQLESPDEDGRTPLSLAARGGCLNVVSALVREGANLQHTDANGWTALHHAASQRHADIVDFLLAHGANQESRTKKGETPLALALVGSRDQFGPPGDRHTTEMVLLSGHPREKINTAARATVKPVAKPRKKKGTTKPAARPASKPAVKPAAKHG